MKDPGASMNRVEFFTRLTTWLLAVLAAAAVIFSYVGTIQLQQEISQERAIIRCQLQYDTEFRRAVAVRDEAHTAIRKAQAELLEAAAVPGDTDPQILQRNIATLKAANEIIENHPLPPVNFCDGALK